MDTDFPPGAGTCQRTQTPPVQEHTNRQLPYPAGTYQQTPSTQERTNGLLPRKNAETYQRTPPPPVQEHTNRHQHPHLRAYQQTRTQTPPTVQEHTNGHLLDELGGGMPPLHQRAGPGRQVPVRLHPEHVRLDALRGARPRSKRQVRAQRRGAAGAARVHQPAGSHGGGTEVNLLQAVMVLSKGIFHE